MLKLSNFGLTFRISAIAAFTLMTSHLNAAETQTQSPTKGTEVADHGGERGGSGGGGRSGGGSRAAGGQHNDSNHGAIDSNLGNHNYNSGYNHNGYNNHNYGNQTGWGGGGYGYGNAGYEYYSQPSYDLDENAPSGEFSFDDNDYDINSPDNSSDTGGS